jgi:hypothetical protein
MSKSNRPEQFFCMFPIIFGFLLVFWWNSSALAKSNSTTRISIGIGASIPEGDLRPGWKLGFNLGGSIGHDFIFRTLNVALHAQYHIWEFDRPPGEATISGRDMRAFEIGPEVQYFPVYLEASFQPYILFSGGWVQFSQTDEISQVTPGVFEVTRFASQSAPYFLGGGGIKTEASERVDFFIEARVVVASPDTATYVYFPLRVGFDFWL